VDIGSVNTRAFLFDTVDGEYRFIAVGSVNYPTQTGEWDIQDNLYLAVKSLQQITGRNLMSSDGKLLLPSQPDGSGFDRLLLTFSTGPTIKIATAGLLADVSLASAQRLAASTYADLVETIGLNDGRPMETQIESLLRARPEIIILTGGTDRGAVRPVYRLAELIRTICTVVPVEQRPDLLYAGNQTLSPKMKEVFEKFVNIQIAPNIRPSVDVEDLAPARTILAQMTTAVRSRRNELFQKLAAVCSDIPEPSASAFGRVVQFLGKTHDPARGVLGVDLGGGSLVMAASQGGKLVQQVQPLGMGSRMTQLLKQISLEEITRWLPIELDEATIRQYLLQKEITPGAIPASEETLAIEQAAATAILRIGMKRFQSTWPEMKGSFEPILASGSVLTQAPSPGQSLLMLLDGLQPEGVTTVLLDLNNLLAPLGTTARLNAVLPVQVLESNAFLNLGTVVAPVSGASANTPVLKARLEYDEGGEIKTEIRQGTLVILPLTQGRRGRLHLQTLGGARIDPQNGGGGSFKVTGGACGVVIDARGRPVALPSDPQQRRDAIKKWIITLGG
jgi:hypothetical protein